MSAPHPERPGCAIGAAGPTTSGRMDKFTPRLLDLGLACMIGKGKRDDAVKAAVVRNGAVYLAALGGAGALMAKSVQTLEVIAWPDLGCEAVRRLTVKDMPLTVILDAPRRRSVPSPAPAAYLESKNIYRLCTKRGRLKTGKTADLRRINLVCFNKLPRIACTSAKSVISCTI
mgnify:CR=1 FL=1